MRKFYIGLLATVFAFGFTSCSTNETELEQLPKALLKSYELKKDASGLYSIDFNVADKTAATTHKNLIDSSNEIHLEKVNYDAKDAYREDFSLENNQLKIGFFDADTGKKSKITIEDENITFAKGSNTDFLKSYGLKTNDDGTIQLDFKVNDNVVTSFTFNEEISVYEVHLSRGTATEDTFSRSLQIPDSGVLKLDFVNHKLAAKGADVGDGDPTKRKPRIIIESEEPEL